MNKLFGFFQCPVLFSVGRLPSSDQKPDGFRQDVVQARQQGVQQRPEFLGKAPSHLAERR
jgi:hypothetical protein